MERYARFHAQYPTDISDEISLADNLAVAVMFRYGGWRWSRALRTDPARVFAACAYGRSADEKGEIRCPIYQGWPVNKETRASNAFILTPSHPEWSEFRDRLHALLQLPDFEWQYGGARMVVHGEISTEYWPLASAEIVADMGFAVAESLAVYRAFLGRDDQGIFEHVESLWHGRKPRPGWVPFDAHGVPSRPSAVVAELEARHPE